MADKALNLQSIVCSEDESLEYNKKSCKKENSALKKKLKPVLKRTQNHVKKSTNSNISLDSSNYILMKKKLPINIQISSVSEKDVVELKISN